MPIPGWVFVKHWNLAKRRRLWRVQSWSWQNTVLEWIGSANVIDNFSREIGDKLNLACETLTRNARPEICQNVGIITRDAWIEFS